MLSNESVLPQYGLALWRVGYTQRSQTSQIKKKAHDRTVAGLLFVELQFDEVLGPRQLSVEEVGGVDLFRGEDSWR